MALQQSGCICCLFDSSTGWFAKKNAFSFTGIDDDDSTVEELIQPVDEDMPVLEGDDDTTRMEEVD